MRKMLLSRFHLLCAVCKPCKRDFCPAGTHCGVPSMFSTPHPVFASPVQVTWHNVPGGTGAMMAALRGGQVDVAIALTEGIIANMLNGNDGSDDDVVIISPFVTSPLLWSIVAAGTCEGELSSLSGTPVGVSRLGSGSHLMAFLLAEREGWDASSLDFKVLGDFTGLRRGVNEGEAGYFLWEHFTTKPFWLAREVTHVGDIPTPWPCFMIAARRGWVDQNLAPLHRMLHVVRQACAAFKADAKASIAEVAAHYGLKHADAQAWFATVTYASTGHVEAQILEDVMTALCRVGVLSVDQVAEATSLVHPDFVSTDATSATPPSKPPSSPVLPASSVQVVGASPPSPPRRRAGTATSGSEAWSIYVCGHTFSCEADYRAWRDKKQAALAAVRVHLSRYGGVQAVTEN